MKCSSAKQKGRRLVTHVIKILLTQSPALLPEDFTRVTTSQSGEDVPMSPAARQLYPLSIECKNVEKINVYKAYEQACKNRPGFGQPTNIEPVVVMSKNRNPEPLVVVNAEYFFRLVQAYVRSHYEHQASN